MKTYVVQLEDHDDVISARDKISWSKARRILLVWPKRGMVLGRQVDLLLLQRHAQQIGAQVAIVSGSAEVKMHARELGIPVFPNPEEAQQVPWRRARSRRRLSPPHARPKDPFALRLDRDALVSRAEEKRGTRFASFGVGLLAFLALVLFFLPGARITLKPRQITQQLTIPVNASTSIAAPNPSGGVPVEELTIVVEGRDQAASTGRARIPENLARGTVHLTNLTAQAVSVPAGSVLVTLAESQVRFVTTRDVTVSAGPGKTAEAPVEAVVPGSAGNAPAGRIRAMEGPLGLRMSVDNTRPLTGGSDRVSPAPTAKDYQTLKETLLANLQTRAEEELRGRLKPGQMLLASTLHLKTIVEETREPQEAQPGDQLQLGLRVEYQAWAVNESDLQVVAQAALEANRQEGYQPAAAPLRFSFASQPVVENEETEAGSRPQSARWNMRVERSLEPVWSQAAILRDIQGRSVNDARGILERRLSLAEPPAIRVYPSWWQLLPFFPFRIEMVQS